MNAFDKVKEKMDNISVQTTCHRVPFMGGLYEIPISSKTPEGGKAIFVQDAERNASYLRKFKPGYFMLRRSGFGKHLELGRISR